MRHIHEGDIVKGKPRLHWFWRGGIATVVASIYGGLSLADTSLGRVHELIYVELRQPTRGNSFDPAFALVFIAPIALIALTTFSLLSLWRRPFSRDGETRCRKCDYILRGISEPRCPECGERI